ncbi:ribonuclease H-like domain-containing protein, partial [Coprinopsis sp. MPI-PUGE-AT-0042]
MSSRPMLHTQPINDRSVIHWSRSFPLPAYPPALCDRTRRFYPSPANATPMDLFEAKVNCCSVPGYRFIKKTAINREIGLIFIDGACLDNGAEPEAPRQPRAGVGIVYGPKETNAPFEITLRQDDTKHTSNRAELSAAISVLTGMRFWPGEGFDNLVLATDSEYLVLGICERIHQWIARGWKTRAGKEVANRDLWEKLLAGIRKLEKSGCHIQFWLIPRDLNEADAYAKAAAAKADAQLGVTAGETVYLIESLGLGLA